MNLRQRNEWIEAAKEQVLRNAKASDQCEAELMFLYDECVNGLETEIRAFYSKFAKDNQLTESQGSALLTGKEYQSWRNFIEGYLKEAEGQGKGSKVMLELNTLAAKSQISRKEQLLANMYRNMANLAGRSEKELTGLLEGLVQTNYERKMFDIQRIGGVAWDVSRVDERLLKQILQYPWSGKNYSKALWDNTDQLAALTRRELTLGFMTGAGVDKIAKEIDAVMGKGRYAAQRLVRTEASYFANQGQLLAYRDAGVEKYRFLGGGCEICQSLNVQVFALEDAKPGENLPPIHPNCKCTTVAAYDVPVFKKREGNPLEENPKFAEWKRKHMQTKGLGAKVSLEGEPKHEEKKLVGKIDFADQTLVQSELDHYTNEIRKDQEKENAIVISPSGNVYHCYGTVNQVFPDIDLMDELNGAYVTHNHPDSETYHSFSAADVSMFFGNHLQELRGTDGQYDYVIRRTAETKECDPDLARHLFSTEFYQDAMFRAWQEERELEDDGYHEIVEAFSNAYGFVYERRLR